jgi:opacity protein-like surface antigen
MRRFAIIAAAAIALTAPAAQAQILAPSPVVQGQNWNMGQDLNRLEATTRTTAGQAALRARMQARHARHFPGTSRSGGR